MRGSLKQRSPGVWSLIYDVPPAPGQARKQKKETFYGNKRDAAKRLNELVLQVQQGAYIAPSVLTTGDYCQRWLAGSVRGTVGPTTLERYERIVRLHITPGIGSIPLSSLQPPAIQDWYNRLDFKPNTIKCIHSVLHRALSQAVALRIIPYNPSDGIELPRCSPSKKDVLCEDDIRELIEACYSHKYYLSVVLLAYTGMRVGEVCGLRWKDIDFEAHAATVRLTAALVGNQLIYKAPKTKNSTRVISLPKLAVAELWNEYERCVTWGGQSIESPICPYRPQNIYNYLNWLGSKLGMKVTPHALRHAHASLLDRAGHSVKVIAERLGHGSTQTTRETYTHTINEQHRDAARAVDEAFGK